MKRGFHVRKAGISQGFRVGKTAVHKFERPILLRLKTSWTNRLRDTVISVTSKSQNQKT